MKALFGDGGSSKYTLPPFPHPLPERSLSLYCTSAGVYIVPARPSQRPSSTSTTSFRRHHLPRISISSTTEDVAHDVKLSKRGSISRLEGARIGWGRTGAVKAVDDEEEVKRAIASSSGEEILCYGVLGIQRLFNGESI